MSVPRGPGWHPFSHARASQPRGDGPVHAAGWRVVVTCPGGGSKRVTLTDSDATTTLATVVTDRDTGRSRGFGFVEMSSASEAGRAITELNGRDVGGRQIDVSEAREQERRSGGGGRGGYSGRRSY